MANENELSQKNRIFTLKTGLTSFWLTKCSSKGRLGSSPRQQMDIQWVSFGHLRARKTGLPHVNVLWKYELSDLLRKRLSTSVVREMCRNQSFWSKSGLSSEGMLSVFHRHVIVHPGKSQTLQLSRRRKPELSWHQGTFVAAAILVSSIDPASLLQRLGWTHLALQEVFPTH